MGTLSIPDPVDTSPESAPTLPDTEVHLWHADLDATPADGMLLSPDEATRAERMIPRVRARYAASRTLLRRILGSYGKVSPESLRFTTVGEGKPVLCGDAGLSFNLSHADARWVLGVSRAGRVGVDVERTDRRVALEDVARRVFRPAELDAILSAPEAERRDLFFRTWTAREALVKVTGEGMFTLSLPARIVAGPDGTLRLTGSGADSWTLAAIPLSDGWVGAVAADAPLSGCRSYRVPRGSVRAADAHP